MEELLQACTEQVTVLFLEQKIYLAILALADNPPEGAEQSIEQGLETLCRFGSRELHMGLSCYCSKDCPRNTSSFAGSIGKMWPVAVG